MDENKKQKWSKRVALFVGLTIAGRVVEIGFDKTMEAVFTHSLRYWFGFLPMLSSGYVHLGIWALLFFGGMYLRDLFKEKREQTPPADGWFSLEVPEEIHSHIPLDLFVRNSGPRFVRSVRFEPIESRRGQKLWIDAIASLALGERVRLGFRAGDNGEYIGVVNHFINFFEGGSRKTDQPPYRLTIRFLDGSTERTEQHLIEGHPLPMGGVKVNTRPIVNAAVLDEKEKHKIAKEEIGKLLEQLSRCERDAYDGHDSTDYDELLGQIQQIKIKVRKIATDYLDASFESRFLAVNVLDVQLDEATKMHFIARAQGSFWTMYQQFKGWRACLVTVLQELGN